jgi:hypothetical protein
MSKKVSSSGVGSTLALGRHWPWVDIWRRSRSSGQNRRGAGRIGRLRHLSPNWTELRMKRRWLSLPIFAEPTLSQEDGPLDSGEPRQATRLGALLRQGATSGEWRSLGARPHREHRARRALSLRQRARLLSRPWTGRRPGKMAP